MQALAAWSLKCLCPGSACNYCAFACVRVLRVHTFLHICSAPWVLPQSLHPNHNYNVISRVRQCPCCCFTFSSSSLLWISNALTLSSESCTALSRTHSMFLCLCVLKGCSWIVLSSSGFDRRSQRWDLGFKNMPSIPLVCFCPCRSKATLHPIQLSSVGCTCYFLFMSHKLQKSQRLSYMQCEAMCQSFGMAVISTGQGCSDGGGLEKRASVKRSLRRAVLCVRLLKTSLVCEILVPYSVVQHVMRYAHYSCSSLYSLPMQSFYHLIWGFFFFLFSP